MRAGIYMGWIGFENLGDEAMYALCSERFASIRWSSFQQLGYQPNVGQLISRGTHSSRHVFRILREELLQQRRIRDLTARGIHKLVARTRGEVGLLGGGTLINRAAYNLDSYIDVRNRTKSLVPTFGTGVASPDFWSGKPGWKDRRKDWVAALAELPVVGVRGPRSMGLLNEVGARNIVVCGDPAIAYYSEGSVETAANDVDRPLRVAINTGDCSGNLWGRADDIEESLVGLAKWLKESKHQIELIPVWTKDVGCCVDIARRCDLPSATVSPALTSHTSFLRTVINFDIVIALKLHAAILSAAANVPCILLEYQPKCRDFAASLEWEQFTIRTDALNAAKLIELVSSLIAQLPWARKKLRMNVSNLSRRFREYCQTIEPILMGRAS